MEPLSGMRIDLFTNAVAGGWLPAELESGLGGSEEVIVLWSRTVANLGADVTVYWQPPADSARAVGDGAVHYLPRAAFDPAAPRDVLITWKDARPWLLGARAPRRIHWSSDVEPPWPSGVAERLDALVCLTPYHARRMPWVPPERLRVIPHGVDLAALDAARCEQDPHLALYASSPDRGLEQVLRDWPRIRIHQPRLTLRVTYGWRQFDACAALAPSHVHAAAARLRQRIAAMADQPGIVLHGALPRSQVDALYWRARYWLLPLAVPDAELFCLNAIKARHGGATAVVHRVGALEDTVAAWLPYERFIAGDSSGLQHAASPAIPVLDWNTVIHRHWLPLLLGDL